MNFKNKAGQNQKKILYFRFIWKRAQESNLLFSAYATLQQQILSKACIFFKNQP